MNELLQVDRKAYKFIPKLKCVKSNYLNIYFSILQSKLNNSIFYANYRLILAINMTQSFRIKYQLMDVQKSNRRPVLSRSENKLKSYFKNTSGQFNSTQIFEPNKIQEFKGQIQKTIWGINSESKKNVVLKTLIALMKKQNQQYQEKSKKTQQTQFLQQAKTVSKINYDVDKILHKNNEQVANLASLKESISSKRSQRVVFSNIFRKIQTQLTNAMITLQKQIIKSENTKTVIQNSKCLTGIQLIGVVGKMQKVKKYQGQVQGQRLGETCVQHTQIYHDDGVKSSKKRRVKQQIGQSRFITQYPESLRQQRDTQQTMFKTTDKIRQHEFQIQMIIQRFNCSNYEQVSTFAENIHIQNQELQQQLQAMDRNICDIQRQQRIIISQRKACLIVERNSVHGQRLRMCKLQSSKDISTQMQTQCEMQQTDCRVLWGLLRMVNIGQGDQLQKLQQQACKLDQKLASIMQQTQQQEYPRNSYSRTSPTPLKASGQQKPLPPPLNNQLNLILQKMQIINQSQKLYDENEFFQAYKKQMQKFTRKDAKKSR